MVDRLPLVVYLIPPAEAVDAAAEQAAVRQIVEVACGPGIRVETRIVSEVPITKGGKRPGYISLVDEPGSAAGRLTASAQARRFGV